MNPLNALGDARAIGELLGEAERVARRLGDEQPSAEHLLLAAVAMPDGAAARTLARFGVDGLRIERAIVEEQAAGLRAAGMDATVAARMAEPRPVDPPTGSGLYRSSQSARELFQAAGALARGARQRLSSAHVALAAADVDGGSLSRILDRLGIERGALRRAAHAELS